MRTIDLDTLVLSLGEHEHPDDGGCLMEWASYMAGEEWSDSPACTSPVIAAFCRSWQDALPDDDRQELRRFVPLVIGTARGPEVDAELAWMATDWLVRVQTPAWLRLAGLTAQADLLASLQPLTAESTPPIQPTLTAVRDEAAAARDAARAAARAAAAGSAAWDAGAAAARAAAWDAGDAAWDAAGAAARDALAPTVVELRASAAELLERMIRHAQGAA